ncbi:ATP-binding protein [Fulvimonas sp. R45]|uniref:ATP-binding protein n=1 Tax=Fulvimonas sp. R45 TaxID=3045937 RepID=UPI00265DE3F9|nr:ATP-binding protein [Fulvimonas sp. R45]MDO1529850.1 ATP-binding protein [Fulvimonas sp. R45]
MNADLDNPSLAMASAPSPGADPALAFLPGGGELGRLVRAHDWSATPLGPPAQWPQSLRTAVGTCLDCSFPIVSWWGRELALIYNDAYTSILGNKHPAALGQRGEDCWREIWPQIGPMLGRVLDEAQPYTANDLLLMIERHGYAEEGYFCFSYSPIRDERGEVCGVFCPVIETTEKVIGARRLETLRELAALRRAESVEAACRQAVAVLARNGRDIPFAYLYLLSDDGAAATLMGATDGSGDRAEIPLDGSGAWPFADALEEPRLLEDLAGRRLPTGDWSEPPRQAWLAPVILPGGRAARAILVAGLNPHRRLDPSYRSFLELLVAQVGSTIADTLAYQAERRRAEALAEIDRAKTRFFSNISHEFRTPLTLMLGPLEDALAGPGLPEAERDRLDIARRNALRLLKLVNSLLDFSRIEASRVQAAFEPTDLAAFTADLASNFRSACEKAGLGFDVDCSAFAAVAHVDRDMWEKIVLNLLSNAFKFTFEGGIAVRLAVVDGQAELTVRDTGVGVPADELPRLFERFHRIEGQRSRTYEGSGIGLALVQELVKLHGGTIHADSAPGRGTTFTVRLPLGAAHRPEGGVEGGRRLASTSIRATAYVEEALRWLPDEPAAAPPPHAVTLVASLPGPDARVLVADDNADMRAYVRGLLGGRLDVETVADGQAALAAIRRRRPDLVLADVMMPNLDGFGLLRAIRGDEALRGMPVILLSARAGEESRIEGLAAGADDYLVKPFSGRELLARVWAHLQLLRVRRQGEDELRASDERNKVMVAELQHRTRNLLGVVLSITDRTLARSASFEDFRTRFRERLEALARVNGLLSRLSEQDRITFSALIRTELAGLGITDGGGHAGQVRLAGPDDVRLRSSTVQTLALGLHELATNALKYGALSRPEGRLSIDWSVQRTAQGERRLRLEWRESGVPVRLDADKEPARKGYGRELIERALPYQLKAETSYVIAPEGVHCTITLPISSTAAD